MEALFIGQVIAFAGNFAPRNWAFCHGQLLSIAQNTALFSILGTTYGGDGRTTFGLPDLRGATAMGSGNGPGLFPVRLGQRQLTEDTTLNILNLPNHTHQTSVTGGLGLGQGRGANSTGDGEYLSDDTSPESIFKPASGGGTLDGAELVNVQALAIGGQQSFSIRNPFLGIHYVIALFGPFPSRN